MHLSHYCFSSDIRVLLALIISSTFCSVPKGANITSIGNYASSGFHWAAGVNDLKFQLQPNTTCSGLTCFEQWFLVNYTFSSLSVVINNFQKSCNSTEQTTIETLDNATTYETFAYPPSKPEFKIECYFMESSLTSIYHILEPLEVGFYILSITTFINQVEYADIRIHYCPELPPPTEEFMKISNSTNARFNSTVTYSCTNDAVLLADDDFSASPETYERECRFDASWSEMGNITCSYAPSTFVKNCNNETFASGTFQTPENVTFCCIVDNFGNPNATRVQYFVTKSGGSYKNYTKALNGTLTLHLIPELNKANVTCQGLNQYTNVYKKTGISPPFTLNVQFGPITDEAYDAVRSSLHQPAILTFNFSANPDIMKSNLNLTFSVNGTGKNISLEGGDLTLENSWQIYTYSIKDVTANDFGLYFLKVSSSISSFDPLILTRNLTGEVAIEVTTFSQVHKYTTSANTGIPDPQSGVLKVAISVSVVGGLIIILIVILLCVKHQRQKGGNSVVKEERENPVYESSSADAVADKEEKLNPLYGSSVAAVNNEKEDRINPLYSSAGFTDNAAERNKSAEKKAKKTQKEERKNPLYASSSNDVIEDAYAEIEKNKIKKGVSHDNALFSVEPGRDTYAEVKKPKKDKPVNTHPDATYAEVQKKGSRKDGSLHGTVNEAP